MSEDFGTVARWKALVNVSPDDLRAFLDTPEGRAAGLSPAEARAAGIRSGQTSARAILRMMGRSPETWTPTQWEWARRQIAFISRMSGARGSLVDKLGRPTRRLLSLWLWGHDPAPGMLKAWLRAR